DGPFAAGRVTMQHSIDFNNPATAIDDLDTRSGYAYTVVNLNIPAITLSALEVGATIGGRADITLAPGALCTWHSGTLTTDPAHPGRLIVSGPAGDTPGAGVLMDYEAVLEGGRILENHGTVDWHGGSISLYDAGTAIENAGVFIRNSGGDPGDLSG